jgi:hypothetical protein
MLTSPFPGMDPYLEARSLWSSIHTRLITAIADDLTPRVAPHFIVDIELRVVVSEEGTRRAPIVPDVYLVARPEPGAGGTTTATITPPTRVRPLPAIEERERFIEIRDAVGHRLVTTIELLSPENKEAGTRRRDAFQAKRALVLASNVNWIEIDLLRAGGRPPEVDGRSDYYALPRRGLVADGVEVWDVDIRDRLPRIAISLHPPFADIPLDLQALLDLIYQRGYYADRLDYTIPPPPPGLPPADAAWAAGLIEAWNAARRAPA